ncbi:hypothetical protein IF1G_04402 [Cordyceps javanica]|uniref:Uncharacterized protein n=1 Tax=Cordyceps javanica TaxID=43265 RepID=A0A545V620_9HYPO|nr:hypothetical protein IF1G_04402 [Cordyceps javanica]
MVAVVILRFPEKSPPETNLSASAHEPPIHDLIKTPSPTQFRHHSVAHQPERPSLGAFTLRCICPSQHWLACER